MLPITDELEALIAASREAPADDMPRLVLADWLEEHGETNHATLIRIQCELSRPSADQARMQELQEIAESLGLRQIHDFASGLSGLINYLDGGGYQIASGIDVRGNWDYRISRGLIKLEAPSIESLETGNIQRWLPTPTAYWIEEINVSVSRLEELIEADLHPEVVKRLVVHFRGIGQYATRDENGRVTMTTATNIPTAEHWRRFVRSPNFLGLRGIRSALGSELELVRVLGDADLGSLIELNLDCGAFADDAAQILATTPVTALSSLRLGELTSRGIQYLSRSPHLRTLYTLDLTGCMIGDDGVIALAESPLALSLGKVSFQNRQMTDRGLAALIRSPLFARLPGGRLNLMMNRISDQGLAILATSEELLRYRELVLRENLVGDDGAEALARSAFARNLQYVDFWRNRVGDRGAMALAESKVLAKLMDLSLKECPVGDAGRQRLTMRFGDVVKY